MPLALYALTAGAFGIGVTEFVIMGLLLEVGNDLGVSVPAAGLLISGYALGVVVGAPLLTILTGRLPRKTVLLGLMVIFTLGNLACAVAPGYALLMAARVLTAFAHGSYFGVGAVVATSLVATDERASAIAVMFTGLTVANVLGVPFGTWLGQAFGWRATFWAVAAIGVAALLVIATFIPRDRTVPIADDWRADLAVMKRVPVLLGLLTTVLGYAGVFAVFTYVAPLLTQVSGFDASAVAPILLLFGIGLVAGNLLGGKLADRHLLPTVLGSLIALAVVLGVMGFALHRPVPAIVLVGLLGVAAFATVAPLQMWILEKAEGSGQGLASSFNIGAFNLGNALGAWLGGVVIARGPGLAAIPWIAMILPLLAVGLALIATRRTSTRRLAMPAQLMVVVLATVLLLPASAHAAGGGNWVGSWMASPQPVWGPDFAFPTNVPSTLQDQTVRQVARISIGGRRIRIVLSNAYGSQPLHIGAARVAIAGAGSATEVGTDRGVTFGGHGPVTLPPGALMVSDPIDLAVAPVSRIAVSLYFPERTPVTTFHWDARQTAYLTAGNQAAAARLDAVHTSTARIILSGIQVDATPESGAVVVLGDSISDGNGATMDRDTRWPDFLAARLAPYDVAVLNAGISGARLLGDRMGANALARFDRDVSSQPRIRTVILLMGINDISWPGTAFDPGGTRPALDTLIAAYRQLIARAHARGIRIVAATLTPFEGALPATPLDNYYDVDKDRLREQVNAWIRNAGEFDAVVDFDARLRDPAHPKRLLPALDSGDHLHPGDQGNQALADEIRLEQL